MYVYKHKKACIPEMSECWEELMEIVRELVIWLTHESHIKNK